MITLDEMLSTAGFYEVSTHATAALAYVLIEIAPDGTVYQLNRRGIRNGVLARDGWSPETVVVARVDDPKEKLH